MEEKKFFYSRDLVIVSAFGIEKNTVFKNGKDISFKENGLIIAKKKNDKYYMITRDGKKAFTNYDDATNDSYVVAGVVKNNGSIFEKDIYTLAELMKLEIKINESDYRDQIIPIKEEDEMSL